MEKYIASNGKAFTIRQPTGNSAKSLVSYSKLILSSVDQIITTSADFTFTTDEIKTEINNLDRNPNSLILIAEIDDQLVGLLIFTSNTKVKTEHAGDFIVNVHPNFQKIGIGTALIKTLLNWARQNNTIKKVYLHVLDTNSNVIKLFKDLGFVEEGRHVKAIKQLTGEYVDLLQMYVWLK